MKPIEERDVLKAGLETISGDDSFLEELQKLPPSKMEQFTLVKAVKLQTALVVFLRTSIRWLEKYYAVKVLSGIVGKDDVKATVQNMRATRSALTTSAIDETYLMAKRREIGKQQSEVLDKLCSEDFFEIQLDVQAQLHNERAPNTGQWFLRDAHFPSGDERYAKWCSGDYSVLWCPGVRKCSFISSV